MFIPTNSDGQIFVNLRKINREKKKSNLSLLDAHRLLPFAFNFFFILYVGPTCPFFFLLGPFKPRNNLFCPGFNFIYLIEYSLNICHFSKFFKNPVFRFHSKFVA